MKLFKKKLFVWTEPSFFCQRVRDRGDWLRAVIPALLASTGVLILLVVARGGNLPWWQIALISLAAGAVVQLGVEAAYMRRDISLDEDSLEAFGNAGQFTSHANYPLPRITSLEIRRSEEIGFPFSMLVLRMENQGGIIGIPGSIRLERLALVLHRLNVPVTLSGWEPPADTTSDQSEHVYSAPENAALQIATVESVPEIDQNLTKLPEMILALLMAGWLMLAWLGLLTWAGIALYQSRQVLSYWIIGGASLAMLASLTIPFAYIEIVGDYFSATFLIRIARNRVQGRAASLIRSFAEKYACVELIRRETWDAVAPKVVDFGFMQVAADRRQILFEGNKERWVIPFSSVKLCKVEEVQYGTGGESANGQLRCYVVLTFQRDSGPFEIGLRNADKEIGKNTDTRRQRKAVELFDYLVPKI